VSGSIPFVDNDLLSSLVETLLGFEHLFDTGYRGVSRVAVGGSGWQGGAVGLAGRCIGISGAARSKAGHPAHPS